MYNYVTYVPKQCGQFITNPLAPILLIWAQSAFGSCGIYGSIFHFTELLYENLWQFMNGCIQLLGLQHQYLK